MFELGKQFRFEAAHTLERAIDAAGSRRIHGHSYRVEVVVHGEADPKTGMVLDLGLFEQALAAARRGLDHQFLDDVPELGPATMENLAVWIWRKVSGEVLGEVLGTRAPLARVTVYRDSTGDSCSYFGATARD
jgi:6-pyruvoyltetrahydropterin/6-carboxytetrahydropterin synthase